MEIISRGKIFKFFFVVLTFAVAVKVYSAPRIEPLPPENKEESSNYQRFPSLSDIPKFLSDIPELAGDLLEGTSQIFDAFITLKTILENQLGDLAQDDGFYQAVKLIEDNIAELFGFDGSTGPEKRTLKVSELMEQLTDVPIAFGEAVSNIFSSLKIVKNRVKNELQDFVESEEILKAIKNIKKASRPLFKPYASEKK